MSEVLTDHPCEKLESDFKAMSSAFAELQALVTRQRDVLARYKMTIDEILNLTPEAFLDLKKMLLASKIAATQICPPHDWGGDGEKCSKCGTKDWMT